MADRLPYGRRNETGDIIGSILSGGMTGYSQAQEKSAAMNDMIMKAIMPKLIEAKMLESSTPDWAKTGVAPGGARVRQTVKTPYGSMFLIPTAEQDPMKAEKNRLEVEGMKQIQGDKEQKKLDAIKLEQKRVESNKFNASDLLNTIEEIKKNKRMNYFGKSISLIPAFAEQKEKVAWQTNLDRLLSKRVLNLMGELKAQSKTGATGMGALSEKELNVLENASTALKKITSPEDAMTILGTMEEKLRKIAEEDISSIYGPSIQPTSSNDIPPGQGNAENGIRTQYNLLRSQGLSKEQARARLGL